MKGKKPGEILRKETFLKLSKLIDTGSVPQAILIQGPAGSGKGSLANQFGMALLCEKKSGPCMACRSCELAASGNHPSFFDLSPEKGEIKVSQIRSIHPELARKSFFGKRRVILIHGGDRMNKSAANSLLKILEEPPEGAHFILTAGQAGRVPPTIRSRCFILHVSPPTEGEMANIISKLHEKESLPAKAATITLSEGNIDLLREIASGKVPDPGEIIDAVLGRNYRKITDIAALFKDEALFRHGLIILKRLLLDLLLLAKDEKQCIMNRELFEQGRGKRLISHPQKLVELYHKLSALEFLPRQVNRAFICESILLSLSEMEA